MSKTHPFSIYLLRKGYDSSNSLKDDSKLKNDFKADNLPDGADLFVLDGRRYPPWWVKYFGIQGDIRQSTKGALVFIKVGDRCFALSFGHAYHNLEDECYEYDFGILVTLNSIDPNKLKSTDAFEPDSARRRRVQLPVYSGLTFFDFDRDSMILKSLTGAVKDKYEEKFGYVTGSSSLKIKSTVDSEELPELLQDLLGLYESKEYKENFPDVLSIEPIKNPRIINKLCEKLIDSLRDKSEDTYLAIPEIIDDYISTKSKFSGVKGTGVGQLYDDIRVENYYDHLERKGFSLDSIDRNILKKHKIDILDENGSNPKSYNIMKCLVFDTIIEDEEGMENEEGAYYLSDGNWYKVEKDYVKKLKKELDECYKDPQPQLPDYKHKNEGEYNKSVSSENSSYICLDRKNIAPELQSQVEPCDLYSIEDGSDGEVRAVFSHVKISTFSQRLSHLFNQGANAIELINSIDESFEKLESLIDEFSPKGKEDAFKAPIHSRNYDVFYVIITHKDKDKKSDNLPLFSRVSLRRTVKYMQLMNVRPYFGFVKNISSKK